MSVLNMLVLSLQDMNDAIGARYHLNYGMLGRLLAAPHQEHKEALDGGLHIGHVLHLISALDTLETAPEFQHRACGDSRSAAFHTFIFHLAGGAEAGLMNPPSQADIRERGMVLKAGKAALEAAKRLTSPIARAVARRRTTSEQLEKLTKYSC